MQRLNFTGHRQHVCVCGRMHVLVCRVTNKDGVCPSSSSSSSAAAEGVWPGRADRQQPRPHELLLW